MCSDAKAGVDGQLLTYLDRLERGGRHSDPCSFCLDKPADYATADPTITRTRTIHVKYDELVLTTQFGMMLRNRN